MAEQGPRAVYASKAWEIDLHRRELRSRGVAVPIGSRAFEILEVLVQSGGELVNKYHLIDRVWPGAVVEENTLHFHISAIRKAFGADRALVNTVSGRGYRLLGNWIVQQPSEPEPRADLRESKARQPFRTNVPIAASALIGRSAPSQHLLKVLSAYRVVTLTGPPGIGKSVLALEVARSLFPTFESDCWLVELASLSDPALVPSAVVPVLGLKIGGTVISAESVAQAIGGEKLLLVLDNCEHLADAAARLMEAIVRMCPNVSVLATSRELLRMEGEYVYRVPPLDVPPQRQNAVNVDEYSSVQLFTTRLMALDSGFSASPENLPLVASICRQLDGIPLAIEFAAARVAMLGLQQVAERLNDRFSLLTAGRRTALPRHQTLRATLDWSYELLPDAERTLLQRLAIFVGGFTLEAATAVMGDTGATPSAVAEGIASLAAKSLVSLDASVPSGRWRLLETIRVYALEKLAESGDAELIARRHAEFFLALAERWEEHEVARAEARRMSARAAETRVFAAAGQRVVADDDREAGAAAVHDQPRIAKIADAAVDDLDAAEIARRGCVGAVELDADGVGGYSIALDRKAFEPHRIGPAGHGRVRDREAIACRGMEVDRPVDAPDGYRLGDCNLVFEIRAGARIDLDDVRARTRIGEGDALADGREGAEQVCAG